MSQTRTDAVITFLATRRFGGYNDTERDWLGKRILEAVGERLTTFQDISPTDSLFLYR